MQFDDLVEDQDPQSAVASKGFKQLGNAALNAMESGPAVSKAPNEGIEPESSPIDLAVMASVPAVGALAHNAGELLGNEVGALGEKNIVKGVTDNIYNNEKTIVKGMEGPKEGPMTIGKKTQIQGPSKPVTTYTPDLENGYKGPSEPQSYADGGEVAPSFDEMQPDAAPQAQAGAVPGFDDLQDDAEKYGTPTEMAKTALEGAARGATFGLSTGLERAAGVEPEAIRARQEVNPITASLGEATGLVGSSVIPGVGEANLLAKAGEGAAAAAGLAGAETLAAKIGSKAVSMAAETALFQAGDEVSKMLASDNYQFSQTAIGDIGLAAVLGAGAGTIMGGVSPLWKAAKGSDLGQTLKTISDRFGGIEGQIADPIGDAIGSSGMEISPVIKASMSQDPGVREMYQYLQQGATKSGQAAREDLLKAHISASDNLASALGRTPEDALKVADLSPYESGKSIGKTLADEYSAKLDPLAQDFDKIKEKYKNAELRPDTSEGGTLDSTHIPGDVSNIQSKLMELADKEGWIGGGHDIERELNRVTKALPAQTTLSDLSRLMTQVGDNTASTLPFGQQTPLSRAGTLIKSVLRDTQDEVALRELGVKAPELVDQLQGARQGYRELSKLKDALDERLSVGGSTSGFAKGLRNMSQTDGERVLNRLATQKDANLLEVLTKNFPDTAAAVRNYHVDNLLKSAADKAGPDMVIDPKTLLNKISKMSPELKNFALSPESLEKIGAIQAILEQIPKRLSPDTGRIIDSMGGALPSALGAIAGATGGHSAVGAVIGMLSRSVFRESSDAAKYAFLKFMGSTKPVDAEGFKQMVDFIHTTMRGEALMSKAVKNVFRAGVDVLPPSALPTEADRAKLDHHVDTLTANPAKIMTMGAKSSHYLPEATTAMTSTVTTALQMLQHAKPSKTKGSPMDSAPVISSAQQGEYKNVLNLAQQPNLILHKVKEGTITAKDVQLVQGMYPAAFQRMQSKLMGEVIAQQSKKNEDPIPYKTRIGLSMIMAQPMDSTFMPQNIMAAQPMAAGNSTPGQSPQSGSKPPAAAHVKDLHKLASAYQTPLQATAQRNKRTD